MCRLVVRCATLLVLAGAILTTPAASAQGVEDPPRSLPMPSWRIAVGGGVMTEPVFNGTAGAAIVVDVARRLGRSTSLVVSGITSRASDKGLSSLGQYDFEREWLIAAIGVETPFLRTPRVDVTLGLQGGAKWSRMRRFSWIGTPPPGEPATRYERTWDEGAMLIPSVQMAYRLGGPLALGARLASVTHVFTDDMFGNAGVLFSVGAHLAW